MSSQNQGKSKNLSLLWDKYSMYVILIAIVFVFSILTGFKGIKFLAWNNIKNILVQSSINSIIAIGASIVIITGGIDLSCGAIVGLVGVVVGLLLKSGMSIWLSCVCGIGVGAVSGLISGIGISYAGIPAFIMTLGVQTALSGLRLAISGGQPVTGFPIALGNIANAKIGSMPIFILYIAFFYTLMILIMHKTKFGRRIYALGGNAQAARLSGVNIHKIQILTYIIAGCLSSVGGILLLSRLCYASTSAGSGYEMDAIAASVIGGISMSGGRGKLINTLIGALILGVLKAGLQILGMTTAIQQIVTGLVIIAAVYLDKRRERKAE